MRFNILLTFPSRRKTYFCMMAVTGTHVISYAAMEWNQLVWYTFAALGGILIGYALGLRRARKLKRRIVQQMNVQSLELLDAKAAITQLDTLTANQERKDKVLKLALSKLQQANKLIGQLRQQQTLLNKKHFIETSRIRLHAVEASEKAHRAVALARKATLHLRRLEKASPVTQTIEAHEPKSYGTGEPVTVSVVDQAHLDGCAEAIAKVSNRDSDRLIKLHSSNEATAN